MTLSELRLIKQNAQLVTKLNAAIQALEGVQHSFHLEFHHDGFLNECQKPSCANLITLVNQLRAK